MVGVMESTGASVMVSQSLFNRIGGDVAVRATVIKMYDKILSDPLLAPFFENANIEALRNSQMAFVTYAFGGPENYSGKNLRTAHANAVQHGLNDNHFDAVAKHLAESMQELSVPQELIDEAMAIVGTTRSDVLNK